MEKIIGKLFLPQLQKTGVYGPRRFAHTPERGYKDALLVCVCTWILALSQKKRIAIYCSDVAGAFDKVSSELLMRALTSKGLHGSILKVICSWLEPRKAHVIVDNCVCLLRLI